MKRKWITRTVAGVLAASLSLSVYAMPGQGMGSGGSRGGGFMQFDQDGDGYLNREEFTHMRQMRLEQHTQSGRMSRNMKNAPTFEQHDFNGDGRISREELRKMRMQRMQQRKQQQNSNGGYMSQQ